MKLLLLSLSTLYLKFIYSFLFDMFIIYNNILLSLFM